MTRLPLMAALLGLAALVATVLALSPSDRAAAQVLPDPGVPVPPVPTVPAPPVPGGALPAPAVPQQLSLRVGDSMVVEGAGLGCRVVELAGRVAIECRRAGKLAGTYGTYISDRTVTVARFRSSRTAQVVLTAKQGGGWRACGTRTRTARAAAEGCR